VESGRFGRRLPTSPRTSAGGTLVGARQSPLARVRARGAEWVLLLRVDAPAREALQNRPAVIRAGDPGLSGATAGERQRPPRAPSVAARARTRARGRVGPAPAGRRSCR